MLVISFLLAQLRSTVVIYAGLVENPIMQVPFCFSTPMKMRGPFLGEVGDEGFPEDTRNDALSPNQEPGGSSLRCMGPMEGHSVVQTRRPL